MLHIYEDLLNYFISHLDILIGSYLIDVKTQQPIKCFSQFKLKIVSGILVALSPAMFKVGGSKQKLLSFPLFDTLTFYC